MVNNPKYGVAHFSADENRTRAFTQQEKKLWNAVKASEGQCGGGVSRFLAGFSHRPLHGAHMQNERFL